MACESKDACSKAYFDGELDLVRSVEFEEHLKTCPDCAEELREQQAMRQSLRSVESLRTGAREPPNAHSG